MSFGTRERGGGGKSRIGGWADFDRDQRRKRQGFPQNDNVVEDPFPALSTSLFKPTSNANTSASNGGHQTNNGSFHLYSNSWAWLGGPTRTSLQGLPSLSLSESGSDRRLIRVQDVGDMPAAVVDDHIGLLPNQSTMPFDQRINCITMNVSDQNENQERVHVGSGTSSTESTKEKLHSCDSDTRKAASAEIPVNATVEGFNGVPVEPEWEDEDDDDVYLRHRKEALRTMSPWSASQHSKAATNAFLRGDHVSAHQHSLKARNQWLAAHTLNAKAAKDILSIRNSQNDVWKLDLHGLHAAEAMQVLKQHLHNIETKLLCKRSVSPNSLKMETKIRRSNSLESFGCFETQNLDKQQQASLRQRPTSLQVITGVGNHSRGQASLPAAVRGFLNENGYCFEELKPGVLTVRPKIRLLT